MGAPDELALVLKALKTGLGGCVEWHHQAVDRVRVELHSVGLSPEGIRTVLIAYVQGGGKVSQIKEQQEEWKLTREFYYKAIVPLPGIFKKGLFVELDLVNTDPDNPEVLLVNAHEQK